MKPLNRLAEERMKEYLNKLDSEGRKVAEKNGKAFVGLEQAFEQSLELMTNEAKQVQVIGELAQVPLMGGKNSGHEKISLIDKNTSEAPLLGSQRSPADDARAKKVAAMAKARAAKGKAAVNKGVSLKGAKPQSNSAE